MNDEKKIRDELIVKLRDNGSTLSEIGKQFNLCSESIRRICARHARKQRLLAEDELYIALSKVSDGVTMHRTYYALKRKGINHPSELKGLSEDYIDKIRGCGSKIKNVIMKLQKMY